MEMKTADRIFAVCIFALGGYIVLNALGYGYMRRAVPGPGFFPFWVGLGMMGLSVANFLRSVRGIEKLDGAFDREGVVKTLLTIGATILFIVAAPWIGMLLTSALFIPMTAFIIQPRWDARFAAKIAAIAVIFPIVCHYLFAVYLGVPLITGALTGF